MDVESDDDEYVDALVYDDINDDDLHISNSCKPLSMYLSLSPVNCFCICFITVWSVLC